MYSRFGYTDKSDKGEYSICILQVIDVLFNVFILLFQCLYQYIIDLVKNKEPRP
jgi:hypothetical protein